MHRKRLQEFLKQVFLSSLLLLTHEDTRVAWMPFLDDLLVSGGYLF